MHGMFTFSYNLLVQKFWGMGLLNLVGFSWFCIEFVKGKVGKGISRVLKMAMSGFHQRLKVYY